MRSQRASTRSRAALAALAVLALGAAAVLVLRGTPGAGEGRPSPAVAADPATAEADADGRPPSEPQGLLSAARDARVLVEAGGSEVLSWGGASVLVEQLSSEKLSCSLEEAAAGRLEAYREEGKGLLWSGFIDLTGSTWACIVGSGAQVELCIVGGADACVVKTFRIVPEEVA